MIIHLREREKNLEPFGWNPQDAEWVALVCLHSGIFTRSQYMAYFKTYPSRARRFVQGLVDLKLAVEEPIPVIRRENRTRACRITHKGIYRELGVPNIRHRRFPDPGAYLRRLLSLDYVIEHAELEWLPTEEEKVWYCEDIGIPTAHLPKRIYTGAAGAVTRHFPMKLPVAGGPTSTFVYVDPGNDTSTEMQHWGRAHEHLWASMRERNIKIHVAAIGVNPDADKRARAVLDGWALEEKRVAAGSPQEAAFEKERDTISSALDTFDSKVLARFGGFTKAGQRYRELRDILARPAPHDIRIDTFEIWRSGRIYPEGVQIYETPS